MKVLIISHTSELGGAEIALVRFLNHVEKFEPVVALPSGKLADILIKMGVSVIILKNITPLKREGRIFWVTGFIRQFFLSISLFYRLFGSIKPDLVQANNLYTGMYCFFPTLLRRKPFLLHLHDYLVGFEKKTIFKFLSYFTDKFICVSENLKKFCENELRTNPKKLCFVRNSFEYEDFSPEGTKWRKEEIPSNKLVLGYLGSLDPRKGVFELVQLFAESYEIEDWILVLACDEKDSRYSTEYQKIRRLIAQRNLKNRVYFVGYLENPVLFLQEIDCFVHLPVKPDPLPNSLVEAGCFSKYIITNDLGGNLECLGETSSFYLLNEVNSNQFAKLINSLPGTDNTSRNFKFYRRHSEKERDFMTLYQSVCD